MSGFNQSNSAETLSSASFLSNIFPDDGMFTCGQSYTYKPCTKLKDDEPQYFAICAITGQARKNDNFVSLNVLVCDDVGTKAATPPLPPSYIIETSSANFQYGYILTTPETDQGKAKGLIERLVRSGYSDPAANGIVRLVRLPGGVNGKDEPSKKYFKVSLNSWSPEVKYNYDALYEMLGTDVVAKGTRDESLRDFIWKLRHLPPSEIFDRACEFRNTFEDAHDFPDSLILQKVQNAIIKHHSKLDKVFGLPTGKSGKIAATLTNVCAALEVMQSDDFSKPESRFILGFDEFKAAIGYQFGADVVSERWVPFGDTDYTKLRLLLATLGFAEIAKDVIRDSVHIISERHSFDSAQIWLLGLPAWDGVSRVKSFCHKYLGGADCEYITAVSKYMWSAMAGRVMVPGIQADMMVVLQGLVQGERKTTAITALAPSFDAFCELSFTMEDKEFGRLVRGKLVAEIAEMKGFGARDSEHSKAVITRRIEETRGMHKEFYKQYKRRVILFGTTNLEQFLNDQTGNRRYLPFVTTLCDRDAIARDRDQLWAEGLALFKKNGIMWQDAQRLAPAEHKKAMVVSPLEADVAKWLNQEANQLIVKKEGLSTTLIRNHLQLTGDPQRNATLIGSALVGLGYTAKQATICGVRARYYTKL